MRLEIASARHLVTLSAGCYCWNTLFLVSSAVSLSATECRFSPLGSTEVEWPDQSSSFLEVVSRAS